MEGGAGSPVVHEMLGALEDALSHEAEGLNHKTAANVLWALGELGRSPPVGWVSTLNSVDPWLEWRLVSNS